MFSSMLYPSIIDAIQCVTFRALCIEDLKIELLDQRRKLNLWSKVTTRRGLSLMPEGRAAQFC